MFSEKEQKYYMEIALKLAQDAANLGEVPIGALIVDNSSKKIIAEGYNQREELQDSLLHAEVNAIQMACKKKKSWRLENTTLFVTLEPCAMCAGAILNSRIPNVIYGAKDLKAGSVDSLYQLLNDSRYNHQSNVISGVLQEDCARMLQNFFRNIRKKK